jgi:hypothetical protein
MRCIPNLKVVFALVNVRLLMLCLKHIYRGARKIMDPVRMSKSGRMANSASGKCLALKSLLKTYTSVRGRKMWVGMSIFFFAPLLCLA